MRLHNYSLLILAFLTVSVPAQAGDWYPIETGRFWVYSGPGGAASSATVQGPAMFAGAIVQPLLWNSGPRENLSQDSAGRVFHHGLTYPDGSYVVFDPPMLRMDSELTVGHQWETVFKSIHYTAGGVEVMREQQHETCSVVSIGLLDVHAGTFVAAEVLRTRAAVGAIPAYTFREMFAEGVGRIRQTEADPDFVVFELESYGPLVAVHPTTWGGIKALYRP